MPKSKKKNRLNTTIDKDLLKQFKILAVQEDKRLNQLLEESIRDVLVKYNSKPSMPTASPAPKQKNDEGEEPEQDSISLKNVETALQEMAKELRETRCAVEKGPKKVSSVIPALTGLVAGLVIAGVFLTANYSDLLKYKFDLDARAIMLSHREDSSAKAAKAGVVDSSIIDDSRDLRTVGTDGQAKLQAWQPQGMSNTGLPPEFETTSPTTGATSPELIPSSEIPALNELFSFRLSAIAWDEDPDQRLVVIDDKILHEGDLVGEVTVLRINPDHVVFSDRDEVFIRKINSEQ